MYFKYNKSKIRNTFPIQTLTKRDQDISVQDHLTIYQQIVWSLYLGHKDMIY